MLCVCRFFPRKRPALLLRAAHLLQKQIPELRVRIVGDGPEAASGFGIAFLEAMAAGKPIVAARSAAIPEVVRRGALVEPNSAEALAEGIRRLWRDPVLRGRIQHRQFEDVEEYEMMRVTKRFLQALERV